MSAPATTPLSRPMRRETPVDVLVREAEIFRPRGTVATAVLLAPMLVALALVAVAMFGMPDANTRTGALIAGIGLGGIWLLSLPLLARVLLVAITAHAEGLEVTILGGRVRELPWALIDGVDRRMGLLYLHYSSGFGVWIMEGGLSNGRRLVRQILLRVSPTVLGPSLKEELALMGAVSNPDAEITVPIALGWQLGSGLLVASGVVLITAGVLLRIVALPGIGGGVALLGIALFFFFGQRLTLSETTLVLRPAIGASRTLQWADVKLVDAWPLAPIVILTMADQKKLTLLGPFFYSALWADLWNSTLDARVISRGVPFLHRWRL
jgi:hypothetical protein